MATHAFTPASQVLERHQARFNGLNMIIAGDIQDDFPAIVEAQHVIIHCTQFHTYLRYQRLARAAQTHFSLLLDETQFIHADTLIYYWPKSKSEAQFQLAYLLHHMPQSSDVFIIGENRTGVKSSESLLAEFGHIKKIDSARRCGLYHFQAETRLAFDLAEWWLTYQLDFSNQPVENKGSKNEHVEIKNLPGVFSQKGLDAGSELLISALLDHPELIKGNILDVGCGSGILSAVIGTYFNDVSLTLTDVSIAALESSKATLNANGLDKALATQVIASDVFSHISDKYHLIISNPPFHDGKQTSYTAADTLIKQAKQHLKLNGYLCIVANAFLPYQKILNETFKQVEVIAQTTKFKVYLASH